MISTKTDLIRKFPESEIFIKLIKYRKDKTRIHSKKQVGILSGIDIKANFIQNKRTHLLAAILCRCIFLNIFTSYTYIVYFFKFPYYCNLLILTNVIKESNVEPNEILFTRSYLLSQILAKEHLNLERNNRVNLTYDMSTVHVHHNMFLK